MTGSVETMPASLSSVRVAAPEKAMVPVALSVSVVPVPITVMPPWMVSVLEPLTWISPVAVSNVCPSLMIVADVLI